ncbi:hypothetical protein [Janthinobacterium agaricidamnosum]|uniref:Uncharacterized protein n=1 Tax=Janthinobacterium agaricidamnosum NBRC 102515 = DSM 9628 TaxID=1349767 RepID=W0UZH8_9BURK|nr:hypothetical protein [Janthinobacterium agaricidamnosum]CDG80785.1 hypothetical protein GJA_119 [Janthinobacterium agaricidamnosum NBRC 102515 = DSM 9628]
MEQFSVEVAASSDKKFIELDISSTDTSEVRLLASKRPRGALRESACNMAWMLSQGGITE